MKTIKELSPADFPHLNAVDFSHWQRARVGMDSRFRLLAVVVLVGGLGVLFCGGPPLWVPLIFVGGVIWRVIEMTNISKLQTRLGITNEGIIEASKR